MRQIIKTKILRKIGLVLLITLVSFSCEKKSKKDNRIIPDSSGKINHVAVVIDNELWEGSVGETIRSILAAPVYGLPQEEPLFSINQIPSQVFTGFARVNRTVLKIEKGKESNFKVLENAYARPQKVIVVSGKTVSDINKQLKISEAKIVSVLKAEEIRFKQKKINKVLFTNKSIEKNMGLTIKFPSYYRIAQEEDNFVWIRRDIKTGTMNVLIYEVPFTKIDTSKTVITQIIKTRDSIGKSHIPGPTDGSYMITEKSYTPFMWETIIDNKKTYNTKGTWEVENAFMAGPFDNYMIEDKINNRYVIVEGFTYAPSVSKRDLMFELEAIVKSIKINE